ncbi:MAG: MoaD/ThiS family protein [Gemmatimonadota bacterium]|nr:MoaD/ThiS family protein [Gemmatimonadota bacterium]
MPITVQIPSALRLHSRGSSVVSLDAHYDSVREALDALEVYCPGVVDRVLTEQGALREHVNVFVDNENTRDMQGLGTPVGDAATITILAAISGG